MAEKTTPVTTEPAQEPVFEVDPTGGPSRGEIAYALLRKTIIEGHLPPGQLLREVSLAKSINVSRTPVREALGRLEQDGLVVRNERGIVVRVNYHTRGAVVAPGAVILEILPLDDKLVIEGRVEPSQITHVHEGQDALVRLTALNQRLTPVIEGKVVYVSADAIAEKTSEQQSARLPFQHQSYIVRVKLDDEDAARKIGDFHPTPGMPADVYIKTGERTFLEYILRPLTDSFARAFRES